MEFRNTETDEHTHSFLSALGQYDHDPSLSPASRAAHALDQTDGTLLSIETHDEVHLTDVQTLLADTRGHQRVEAALAEPPHHLNTRHLSV